MDSFCWPVPDALLQRLESEGRRKTMKIVATYRMFAYLKSKVIISQDQKCLSSKTLKSEQWPLFQ